ncbi:MAG TPA: adenylate cyclase regulatory domain-containing protein [Solirubrobacteraceae bacterium]|nr:adenylate cyclase regulatory domain-containing protein [Solirubrobacteraceae bacterium]
MSGPGTPDPASSPPRTREAVVAGPDFAALGLLEGLEGEARAARLALLEALHDDGAGVEELRAAIEEGRLALLPAERALGATGTLTPRQVAEMTGVDLAALEAVRRAAGLPLPSPDEPALGDLDLMGATALYHFVEAGLPVDSLVEASRVFGEAAAHAAAAAGTLANAVVPQPGDTELAYAQRLGAVTRELTPYAAGLLGVLYRLHNRENLRNEIVAAEEIAEGRRRDVHDVAIGFCDLVGFTRLGEGVPAADLGAVATRLAALAVEAVQPPVRLVKTIGDGVMLASPDPAELLEAVFALMAGAEAEGEAFPAVHAGVAFGPALRRWGDYYGSAVNRAARLAERARPSSVLADEGVRGIVGDDERFAWSDAGAKRLKGVPEPVPVLRVRPRGQTPSA